MAKLQSYRCRDCQADYEFMHHPSDEKASCPSCGSNSAELQLGGVTLTTIIPVYPGAKRFKAGYQHTHADFPAEKGSVSVPRSFKGD